MVLVASRQGGVNRELKMGTMVQTAPYQGGKSRKAPRRQEGGGTGAHLGVR